MSESAKPVEVVFIVDESGSMQPLRMDTIGGLNSLLAEHRGQEGEAYVTIVTFADEHRTIVDHEPISEVADITVGDYDPRGCTALLDAVGDTVKSVKRRVNAVPKAERANVIVIIITDGEENASRRYDTVKIKRMVEKRKAKGWEFLFLGANIDAFAEASLIGISHSRSSAYVSDSIGTGIAYETMSAAVSGYRRDAVVLDSWSEATTADAEARG